MGAAALDSAGHLPMTIMSQRTKNFRWRCFYAILVLLAAGGQDAVSQDLMVVPAPRQVVFSSEEFLLDRRLPIVISSQAGDWERFIISEMQRFLKESTHRTFDIEAWGSQIAGVLIGNPERDSHVARRMDAMGLTLTAAMRAEGYVLGIDAQGVVIGAVSPAGLLYGTMTLRQMLSTSLMPRTLPGVTIHDWPELQVRGISDDIARGQVSTMANFRKIIRSLAAFKLNTMLLYLQDMYRFETYPAIGAGRGALTREQVDALEAYAARYNVEIIPVFEMLGHQPVLLLQPEYAHLAEFSGAHCFAINDVTLAFLEGCVRELADVFDSPYLHAGLDESADLGYGKTETLVRQKGLGLVYADYYAALNDIIRKHGKTMMMYSDIVLDHPDIMDRIPHNIIQMEWQHGLDPERFAHMPEFLAHDFAHITHSEIVNYHRFFPGLDLMKEQVRRKILSTLQQKDRGAHVLGHVVASWGDQGGKGLRELNYFGYAYGSELMWSPETRNDADFALHFMAGWYGPASAATMREVYDRLGRWPITWDRRNGTISAIPLRPACPGIRPR